MPNLIDRDFRTGGPEMIKTILPRALKMLWNERGRTKPPKKTEPEFKQDGGPHTEQLNFDWTHNARSEIGNQTENPIP